MAICTLLGVVLTVGSSWAVSVWDTWRTGRTPWVSTGIFDFVRDGEVYRAHDSRRVGGRFVGVEACPPPVVEFRRAPAWVRTPPVGMTYSMATGWPRVCMVRYAGSRGVDWAWQPPIRLWGSWLVVPLRPLWPGFAINTAFYASLSWILLFAPFALRSLWRSRRGRCRGCGYELSDLVACPECGRHA